MRSALIIVGVIVFVAIATVVGAYNSFVNLSESVDSSWAQVENRLKQRADLIPNLVATVQGIANQEQEVFGAISAARAALAGATTINEQIEANQQVDSALSRLLVVVENYPELRSSESFLRLQDQLEGMESRIATERMRYNEAVRDYNTRIRRFPGVFFAGIFGYDARPYYNPPEGDLENPTVDFS